jgi:hypothetical protein
LVWGRAADSFGVEWGVEFERLNELNGVGLSKAFDSLADRRNKGANPGLKSTFLAEMKALQEEDFIMAQSQPALLGWTNLALAPSESSVRAPSGKTAIMPQLWNRASLCDSVWPPSI